MLNTWCRHGGFVSWFVSRMLLRCSSTTVFSAWGEAVFLPRSRAVHVCLILLPNPFLSAQLRNSFMSGAGSTHSPIQSPTEQQMKDFYWPQWTWNQVLSRPGLAALFVVSPNCWPSMWQQPNTTSSVLTPKNCSVSKPKSHFDVLKDNAERFTFFCELSVWEKRAQKWHIATPPLVGALQYADLSLDTALSRTSPPSQ